MRPIEQLVCTKRERSHRYKRVGRSQMFETALKEYVRKASTLLTMCDWK